MNALNVYVLFENINQLISKQYLQFFSIIYDCTLYNNIGSIFQRRWSTKYQDMMHL